MGCSREHHRDLKIHQASTEKDAVPVVPAGRDVTQLIQNHAGNIAHGISIALWHTWPSIPAPLCMPRQGVAVTGKPVHSRTLRTSTSILVPQVLIKGERANGDQIPLPTFRRISGSAVSGGTNRQIGENNGGQEERDEVHC